MSILQRLPSELVEKITESGSGSCDHISEEGKQCYNTWEFKTARGNNYDCQKYCREHCATWIHDFFTTEPEKTYEVKGMFGYGDNLRMIRAQKLRADAGIRFIPKIVLENVEAKDFESGNRMGQEIYEKIVITYSSTQGYNCKVYFMDRYRGEVYENHGMEYMFGEVRDYDPRFNYKKQDIRRVENNICRLLNKYEIKEISITIEQLDETGERYEPNTKRIGEVFNVRTGKESKGWEIISQSDNEVIRIKYLYKS